MFQGCFWVSIGGGHQGSSQQDNFGQTRRGSTKVQMSWGEREEKAENGAGAQRVSLN